MRSKFLSIMLAALLLLASLPAVSFHVYGDENTPATPETTEISETADPEKETDPTPDPAQSEQSSAAQNGEDNKQPTSAAETEETGDTKEEPAFSETAETETGEAESGKTETADAPLLQAENNEEEYSFEYPFPDSDPLIRKVVLYPTETYPENAVLAVQSVTGSDAKMFDATLTAALGQADRKANTEVALLVQLQDENREPLITEEHPLQGKLRIYLKNNEDTQRLTSFLVSMDPATYSQKGELINAASGQDPETGLTYLELELTVRVFQKTPIDAVALAEIVEKIPDPEIIMQVAKVDGRELETPAATYPVPFNHPVELKAYTKAPDTTFYMFIGGALQEQKVTAQQDDGKALKVEQLTRPKVDYGPGPVYRFSNADPGAAITLTISGNAALPGSNPDYADGYEPSALTHGIWFVAEDEVDTFGVMTGGLSFTKGGALCFLGRPALAFAVYDQSNNALLPSARSAGYGVFDYLSNGAPATWGNLLRRYYGYDSPEQKELVEKLDARLDKVLLHGPDGSTTDITKNLALQFDKPGTYTLELVPKAGMEIVYEPMTIELTLDAPSVIHAGGAIVNAHRGMEMVADYTVDFGYHFKVNGKEIPFLTLQEMNSIYNALYLSTNYGPVPELPKQMAATSAAIAKLAVSLPDSKPILGRVVMRILKDGEKKEAVAAAYEDEIRWESIVDVGSTRAFDWIVELRYDVNNQQYPTGEGVNPLFDFGEPEVSLVLQDGSEVKLTKDTHYTLEQPEGYFKVDMTRIAGKDTKIDPRDFNGNWPMAWYEISPRNGSKPYYLHPFFQKQVIRITPAASTALPDSNARVVSIIVRNSGKLSSYAYTGGYGNPARVLAFGRYSVPVYSPPKKTRLQSLQPNPDADAAPEYYTRDSGYTNLGFDTTAVYASAVTVHKVDPKKNDLKGAEFRITDLNGGETNARIAKGQSTHLILSHFMPGFSVIRPVPDSVDDVSRRNLTSIGEPALTAAKPSGDATDEKGILTFSGLTEGSYLIEETKAPEGYVKGEDIRVDLTVELPSVINTGYEFCRWIAKINGEEIPVVNQLSDQYPDVKDEFYQIFTCNSSFIVLRVTNEEATNVKVTKVWEDENDAAGRRSSASAEIQLYKQAEGETQGTSVGEPVAVGTEDGWSYTFENLPVSEDGKQLTYYVEETMEGSDYTSTVSDPVKAEAKKTGEITVTNTYVPKTIELTVTKSWKDAEDKDKLRPQKITVKLLANGEETGSYELSEKEGWTLTIKDLPETGKNGRIRYTVKEDKVEGYTTVISGTADKGFTITNTHIPEELPEKISTTIRKVWNDKDDKDKLRPQSVTVRLYADGKEYGSYMLDAKNKWSVTVDGLLTKNEKGEDIVYTVKEDSVVSYTVVVSGDLVRGFTVTNSHTPKETPPEPKRPDVPNTSGSARSE